MAKATSNFSNVTVRDERTLLQPVTIQPAMIVDDATEVAKIDGLPAEFLGGKFETGFPPTVRFEKPGDFIGGEFIHKRENIGPNNSRVYELGVTGANGALLKVVVWGSTTIDQQWDSAYPPVQQGDKVAIIYIGEKETSRKQNPVKLFAFKVIRK